jgi:hypothetical protein
MDAKYTHEGVKKVKKVKKIGSEKNKNKLFLVSHMLTIWA